MRCPAGHELPHETKQGQCTPLYCSADGQTPDGTVTPKDGKKLKVGANKPPKPFKRLAESGRVTDQPVSSAEKKELRLADTAARLEVRSAVSEALPDDEMAQFKANSAAEEASLSAITRAGTGLGTFSIRQAFLKTPRGMKGEEAENWAAAKSVELLPTALGEVEFRLKFGNDDQRYEAAIDVLDMNGMRKRDAINSGGNTIILNIGQNGTPWAKKIVQANTVDAVVVKEGDLEKK